jgi:L-asparaginase
MVRFARFGAVLFLVAAASPAAGQPLPEVHLIGTGGTISGGAGGPLNAGDLRSALPGLASVASVTTEDFVRIGSSRMHPELQLQLAERIAAVFAERPELAGIVVTHGTDSLEETAFLLDLVLPAGRPVVFAAAQRPPRYEDSDGPRNLLDAIRVAGSRRTRGLGVLVVLNGQIHAAREVRKTHSIALHAFASPDTGPVGMVDDGTVLIFATPARRAHVPATNVETAVALVRLTAGGGASAIRAAAEAGVRGIVVEVFGRGNAPPPVTEAVDAAIQAGVTVVFVTRTGAGRVVLSDAQRDRGILSGGDLDGLKARILLVVALGAERSADEIGAVFRTLSGAG